IIKNSLEVILLVDSSKFDAVKAVHFCEIDDVDIVVTDKNIKKEWISYLKEKGIRVIIADK
ncbi:MAG: DeoR/GlpR transcriptional regulator, partial [Anaerococcus sp.]|nr:DeoR/GlpR transcriptional regulator [Anaerococcus sp.]